VIRILVASRSSVVRAGLESLVRSSSSLQLAGALDWALVHSADFQSDVLLLEAGDMEPDQLRVLTEGFSLPIVLLLDTQDAALLNAALHVGVRGVISLDATPEEIESAIQAVHVGLIVIASESLPDLLPDARPVAEALAEPLSGRELEVLDVIAEGLSNKLIAHRLGISEHTVKTHVAAIFAKLGASTRTEAVSLAIRRGLVML
jgi:NarL family two-component system response regulator YdfI